MLANVVLRPFAGQVDRAIWLPAPEAHNALTALGGYLTGCELDLGHPPLGSDDRVEVAVAPRGVGAEGRPPIALAQQQPGQHASVAEQERRAHAPGGVA